MPTPIVHDYQPLREYCATRSSAAFRELVESHLPAVWSAALRRVNGDAALAEDIAQEVFTDLAAKAPGLPAGTVLGGWLHRHTCFTAAKAVRTAARRRTRESEHAHRMTAHSAPDPWQDIAPHLNEALNSLPAADRDAVVLRFFEKQDFRSIAAALGTSEDAARMKTARALEKMRGLLSKRSAALTVALLGGLLAEQSIAAPPVGLAGRLAESALSFSPAAAGQPGWLARGLAVLRDRRAIILSGAVLLLSGAAVWQLVTMQDRGRGTMPVRPATVREDRPAQSKSTVSREVAVHFLYVPEAQAAPLMDARWGSEGDGALLKQLLAQAGEDTAGIQLARVLRHTCPGGTRSKLERAEETPYPRQFEMTEDGVITPREFETRNLGSIAELELTISEDGEWCDFNIAAEQSFDTPGIHRFPTSLADPDNEALSAAKMPEFHISKVQAQYMMRTGSTQLLQCSLLPRRAPLPPMRLFVFATVTQP